MATRAADRPESGQAPGPIRGLDPGAGEASADVIVIGGGIYGVAVTLEAARRGLRPVLVEQDDFGGGVSWSSHRIVHGGLRYLQSLDLSRFRDSVRERRWFLETFPELVSPLGCLVPLTNRGTRRKSLFACAAVLNNGLNRAFGGATDRLPGASVIHRARLADAAPGCELDGVSAAGLWHDGLMVSSERVLIGMLRAACDLGAVAVNRASVIGVGDLGSGRLEVTCERSDGTRLVLTADRVINAAGPASGQVAEMLGGEHRRLFEPMRAFNLLLDVDPRLSHAVALESREADGRMLFMVPGPAGLAVGTWEEPYDGYESPTASSVEHLLSLSRGLLNRDDLVPERVTAVWSGLLPRAAGKGLAPADRPVMIDHGAAGGLAGAFSVSGVKYTTARLVGEQMIRRAYPNAHAARGLKEIRDPWQDAGWFVHPPESGRVGSMVERMIRDEAAGSVDDVCRRRTAWYASPERLRAVSADIGAPFGLDAEASARAVGESIGLARLTRR